MREDDHRKLNGDDWRIPVYYNRLIVFILQKKTHRFKRTATNTSTTFTYGTWATGTSSTSSAYPATYFIETVEYFGMLHGNEHKFSSLGEAIDVMCTKHRMMK